MKKLPIFILIMMLSSLFAVFMPSVLAESNSYGFENTTLTQQANIGDTGNGFITTGTSGIADFVTDVSAFSSEKSYVCRGYDGEETNTYFNYTYDAESYLTVLSFAFNWDLKTTISGLGHFYLENETNDHIIDVWMQKSGSTAFGFYYYSATYDAYQDIQTTITASANKWFRLNITILANDSVYYSLYDINTGALYDEVGAPKIVTDAPRINSLNFTGSSIDHKLYIDDMSINYGLWFETPEEGGDTAGDTIYFQLYNIEDGKKIQFNDFNERPWIETYPWVLSTVLPTNYAWDIVEGKIKITDISFVEGTEYTFYFSGDNNSLTKFPGTYYFADGTIKNFYFGPKTFTQQFYHGQTYSVYLYPTDYIDGVNYSYGENNQYVNIFLNRRIFNYGETLRMRFQFTPASYFLQKGLPTDHWQMRIVNYKDQTLGDTYIGTPFVYYERQDDGAFYISDDWQTLEVPLISYNDYGFFEYYNKYLVVFMHPYSNDFWVLCKLPFWLSGNTYEPYGEITAVTPNPAYFGQNVQIAWTSNTSGEIRIGTGYSEDSVIKSISFGYSDSTFLVNWTPPYPGRFAIQLFLDEAETGAENITEEPIDTEYLLVTPKNNSQGTYGQFGYGVPYLWIPDYRLIAGYDNCTILYRTYTNNSKLYVYSPRDEQTAYSTTVSNASENVYTFALPNLMLLGTWNVSFHCGDIYGNETILNSSFNVINEEGNWIQFEKNTYYDNEPFTVYLKHDYRIALTFYKNDIAIGENIIFQAREHDGDLISVSQQYIDTTPGEWRVEMYRINNLNRIYELAQWECVVLPAPFVVDAGSNFGFNVREFINNIDPTIRAIFGISICIGLLLIPILVVKTMKRPINIPPLVYAVFFCVGVVVSFVIGFWGLEIMFFLASMTALIIVGLYFMGKSKSAPAEA